MDFIWLMQTGYSGFRNNGEFYYLIVNMKWYLILVVILQKCIPDSPFEYIGYILVGFNGYAGKYFVFETVPDAYAFIIAFQFIIFFMMPEIKS